MATSPKKMPALGASPGPNKRFAVTASTSSTPAATKLDKSAPPKAKSSSGAGGKAKQLIAAVAALALALSVARWLSISSSRGGSSPVVELSPRSPAPAVAKTTTVSISSEIAFDAEDPDSQPLPGLHLDGGANAPRLSSGAWPARVRVERQRLKPRKRGAMEKAVEELSAMGIAELVDEGPDTPWDVLIPSKIGGLERLRINKLRKGQLVGTVPEPLSSRKNLALVAARSGWPSETVPRSFQLMSEYQDWLDSEPDFPTGSRWVVKSSSQGHPRYGHEGHSSLPTAAAATMLPQATFELAQVEMPPPLPPTSAAGASSVFGARHQLKLFVAVTSVQPPRAYVFDGGVLTLRERESVVQAVLKTGTPKLIDDDDDRSGSETEKPKEAAKAAPPKVPFYAHWMGPWHADATGLGADAVAKQAGRKGARKLRLKAEEAATNVFRWLSLPGRLGDPHGDLQFSIAPGSAFEIFSVETVFSSAPDAKNSTSSTSAWVVDVKPSSAERLGADIDFLLSPARVANAPACDSVVVGALRSGLEMQLRRREREQAREAGACDENEGKTTKNSSSFSSPKVWSSAGDPCSHLEDEEAWEVEQAAALGWKRLDLEGSSAPKSLLDRSPEAMAAAGKPKRKTPRDAASIQAAAEALARAVNGDVRG